MMGASKSIGQPCGCHHDPTAHDIADIAFGAAVEVYSRATAMRARAEALLIEATPLLAESQAVIQKIMISRRTSVATGFGWRFSMIPSFRAVRIQDEQDEAVDGRR